MSRAGCVTLSLAAVTIHNGGGGGQRAITDGEAWEGGGVALESPLGAITF
jgi:hypothetical protein